MVSVQFPIYNPMAIQPLEGIKTIPLGPPDMSQQLQQGIGGLYKGFTGARDEAEQRAGRHKVADLIANDPGAAAALQLQQPGGPYAGGPGNLSGPNSTNPATATSPTERKIPTFTALPNKGVAQQFQGLFDQHETQYGLPPGTLGSLAFIESKFNPNAKNPKSSAGGLFQQIDSNWKAYGDPNSSRYDPAASTAAAAKFAAANATTLQKALGRNPTVGELYLAHQQGPGGALKLLSNPDARAVDIVGEKAVRLNGGRADMSAREFAGIWSNKADSVWRGLYGGREQPQGGAGGAPTQTAGNAPPGPPQAAPGGQRRMTMPEYQDFVQRSGGQPMGISPDVLPLEVVEQMRNAPKPGIESIPPNAYAGGGPPGPQGGQTPPAPQQALYDQQTVQNAQTILQQPESTAPMKAWAQDVLKQAGTGGSVDPQTTGSVTGGEKPLFANPTTGTVPAPQAGTPAQPVPPASPGGAPGTTTVPNPFQGPPPGPPPGAPPGAPPSMAAMPGQPGVSPQFQMPPGTEGPPPGPPPAAPPPAAGPAPAPPSSQPLGPVAGAPPPQVAPQAAPPAPQTAAAPPPQGVPPQVAQAVPQAVQAMTAGMSPNQRQALAAAIRSGDPTTIKAVQSYIEQANPAGKGYGFTEVGGQLYRTNPVTGEATPIAGAPGGRNVQTAEVGGTLYERNPQTGAWTPAVQSNNPNVEYKTADNGRLWKIDKTGKNPPELINGSGQNTPEGDLILPPNDPRRSQYPGIPQGDNRTYRVRPSDRGPQIEPMDEREAKTFERENQLATGLEGNATFKTYRAQTDAVNSLEASFKQGNAAGDMNGLVQVFKVIDPDSTVSQNESGQITATGGSNAFLQYWSNKLNLSNGIMTPQMRAEFMNSARDQLKARTGQVDSIINGTRRRAQGAGLDPDASTGYFQPYDFNKPRFKADDFVHRDTEGKPVPGGGGGSTEGGNTRRPGGTIQNPVTVDSVEKGDSLPAGTFYSVNGKPGRSDGSKARQ